MFDHELPVAAVPKGSVVDLSDVELDGKPGDVAVVEVVGIRHSEPRPGLITWETKDGPSFTLPANLRVPVNLPPERSQSSARQPRRS